MMQPRSSANENPFEPNRDHANNGHDYNPYSDSVSTFPLILLSLSFIFGISL